MNDAVLNEILQEIKDVKSSQLRTEERLGRVEESQEQMNGRLGRVEEKQDRIDERLVRVEEKQDRMEERLVRVEEKQDRMGNDITEIKASVKRIEENEPQEVLSLLKIMNRKMDHFAIDIEYLKEKTGKHDAEINRLNKLTQS